MKWSDIEAMKPDEARAYFDRKAAEAAIIERDAMAAGNVALAIQARWVIDESQRMKARVVG